VAAPVFNYASFIAQFPALASIPQATIQMAWDMGNNWINQQQATGWGIGSSVAARLQQAADLMGAVILTQLYSAAGPAGLSGPLNAATQGSVNAAITLPDVGSSAFRTMLLSAPPYGAMLLALLQIAANVGPYIGSYRPGSSSVPP
jgi:Protein of unknown function (DUF4054)